MGFMDKAKEAAAGHSDKVADAVDQHSERIDSAIDKAGELANEKTGGKYADQIDAGSAKVRVGLDSLDGKDDDCGHDTSTEDAFDKGDFKNGMGTNKH